MAISNPNPAIEPARDQIVWDRLFNVDLRVNANERASDDSRQIVNVRALLKPSRLDGSTERVHPTEPAQVVNVEDVLGVISGVSGEYSTETRQKLGLAFQAIIDAIIAVQGEQ